MKFLGKFGPFRSLVTRLDTMNAHLKALHTEVMRLNRLIREMRDGTTELTDADFLEDES